MPTICKNCNNHFEGKFCNNCGQSANIQKINFHFLWHEFQHGFFHLDKGIFYTIKQLFLRPGHSIREFIEGKRVNHFKPISLIIVLATIYGVLYHSSHINLIGTYTVNTTAHKDILKTFSESLNEWLATHFAWVTLLTIPFFALGSRIAFKKQEYNYTEHIVLNSFLAGQRIIIHLVTFPFLLIYNGTVILKPIVVILNLLDPLLMIWVYSQFFNKVSKIRAAILAIFSFCIYYVLFVITMGMVVLFFLIIKYKVLI
jgi:hypothetical protein